MEDYEMQERPSLLEEDLTCPVCKDIFKEPGLLPCSHSFCRDCLERYWQQKGIRECPVCRKRCEGEPIPNLALRNTCESYRKEKGCWAPSGLEPLCGLHRRELVLYCVKDEEPVCVECVTLHPGHELRPVDRGVPACKEELNIKIKVLEEKLDLYKKIKRKYSETLEHIKIQTQQTQVQISSEFEKLRKFLAEEEARRIAELKSEEEEKKQKMKSRISELNKDISKLSELLQSIKREMGAEDLTFLQNFQSLKRRAQWINEDPPNVAGGLIDVAGHLGSLGYRVWEKMQSCVQKIPVILDPNTASPWLWISPDLSSVKDNHGRQQLPDNLERFDPCVFIMGSQGFTSGRHRWDVRVGDNPKWILGVCKESVVRKRRFTVTPSAGVWTIGLSKGTYNVLTTPRTVLNLEMKPDTVRVKLNMDKGEVSFFNPSDGSHICTFTEKFTERVFPLFGPGLHSTPMTVCPAKVIIRAV
ncbi:tripartite motif containing 35-28 isoform X1 [Paramormyrops kingsleyae]|uniref:tripartite motif containing 35-28 isoform X1 n=1 Tax=Paramormyrops kingsleyae TaxID=1676925 RepID=UPI000CD64D32|nr:nuclear factor 7, brain-like isoform X2 [Paramormyrops kingsleyae]